MAGISSNALRGMNYPENRKKYNGIEFTEDLDLNIYDAQYRNLDPQVGRWWQIDSRPNYSEGPYASMGNNPAGMIDPLGDTTQYFDAYGKHLYTANDNLKNAITVIPSTNAAGFSLIMKLLNTKLGARLRNNNDFNSILRGAGISYSPKDYFSVYDQHSEDIYTGGDIRSVDGKPLVKEYKIRLYDDGGYMNARGEDDKNGTPGLTILSQGDAQGTLHTHAEEGRKVFTKDGISNQFGTGEEGMRTDIRNSRNVPGTGYFNVVVTKSEVRLYNTSGVVITIDRSGDTFKKIKK